MAGPWGSGSGSSSGPWGGGSSAAPPKPKKKKKGGFGGLLGNLAEDVTSLSGIPMGMVQMARTHAPAYKKSTWTDLWKGLNQPGGTVHTWKPLFMEADIGETKHRIYEHPLAPVLDILTVGTGGVGATARIARLAAPASRIAEASRPGSIMLKAPRTAKGVVRGPDIDIGPAGMGGYINPLRQARMKGVNALAQKMGLEAKRWERHNQIRLGRDVATVDNYMKNVVAASKVLTEKGPSRQLAQMRIFQNFHNIVTGAAHEMDELPTTYEYVRREAGPELYRAKPGHSFVQRKHGWEEVADPARLPTEKTPKTTKDGAFLVRGNTLRLINVAGAKGRKTVPGAGGSSRRVIREDDGSYTVTGGFKDTALKEVSSPEGKTWAKVAPDKWKLVDEKPKGVDKLRPEPGMVLVKKGNRYTQKKGNVSLGRDMEPEQFAAEINTGNLRQRLTTRNPAEAKLGPNGKPLAVPKKLIDEVSRETAESTNFLAKVWRTPTKVWRGVVLGTPRYFVNNMVGNSFMFVVNNPTGFKHYLEATRIVKGHHAAQQIADATPGHGVKWMDEVFGNMYGHGFVEHVPDFKGPAKFEKKWYGWVNRVTEERYRVAAVLQRVRRDPEIMQMRKQGLSEYDAVITKRRADPQWSQKIAEDVDNIFGQYRYLNNAEKVVRDIVPFYGWSRAIARSTLNTFKDRPGRAYIGYLVGQQGIEETQKKLGEVPRFLKGAIPMGKKGDRERILTTQGLNPYQTPVELVQGVTAALGGPGRVGETLGSQTGPLPGTAIELLSGDRLLTGEPHGKSAQGLLLENFGLDPDRPGLPPLKLALAFARKDQPGTYRTKTGRQGEKLYDPDRYNELLSQLGFPMKYMSKKTAQKRARDEEAY